MTVDNQTPILVAPSGTSRRTRSATVDYVVAGIALALFAIWIFMFRFHGVLEEYDLYVVVSGLLDGADSGTKLASPLQYGPSFSFGYIAAMYWFVSDRVLRDPNLLIPLVNQIGSWAAIIGAACFWLSTRLLYGLRVATVALILFVLSPMMLESATSGHQILLAFAFFAAGSIFLFLRTSGWPGIACEIAGCFLLTIALTVRAEIFLALPYVVLARADFRSVGTFVKSAFRRCIGPALAFVSFFLMKHFIVDRAAVAPLPSSGFFDMFYTFRNIPKGVVVIFFGCGVATTLLALVAAFRAYRTGAAGPESTGRVGRQRRIRADRQPDRSGGDVPAALRILDRESGAGKAFHTLPVRDRHPDWSVARVLAAWPDDGLWNGRCGRSGESGNRCHCWSPGIEVLPVALSSGCAACRALCHAFRFLPVGPIGGRCWTNANA